MLNFRRFALRNNSRRRPAIGLPRAAEVCESRVLLSGAPAAEVVADAAEPEVVTQAGPPAAGPTASPIFADGEPGEIPPEGPGEIPGEAPGEEPGGDYPDEEFGLTSFIKVTPTYLNGNVTLTGQVASINGGDSIVINISGIDVGTAAVDANGNFTFTYAFPAAGNITLTAFDHEGYEGETWVVF
jgi:hypothetical protein